MFRVFTLLALVTLALPMRPLAAQDTEVTPTIAAYIEQRATDPQDPQFTLLWAAIQAADPIVLETYAKPWGITAFLPTDTAFEATLDDMNITASQLFFDSVMTTKILLYHLTIGQFSLQSLASVERAGYATLYADHILPITASDEAVLVGDAAIDEADITLSNGIAHSIDRLLIPNTEDLPPVTVSTTDAPQTILSLLKANGDFTIFVAALEALGLDETVNKAIPYTIFAPTDATMTTFLDQVGLSEEELLANTDTLSAIIQYHMVGGKMQSDALANNAYRSEDGRLHLGTQMPTTTLEFTLDDDNQLLVDGVSISQADMVASNGYIQVIDGVLLP